MMVAMNPETWDEDVAEIEPGGYLFYDSTKPLPPSKFRDDINVIGAPLTAICNREYTDARQRQLFKNIIYLGVLSALLDIDVAAIEKLIGEQFRGRDTLIKPNLHALGPGARLGALRARMPDRAASEAASTRSATASLSPATTPPHWAASTAGRRSPPGIRSPLPPRSPRPFRLIATAIAATPTPRKSALRSSRPRTSLPRSASSSAPRGTVREPLRQPRARASR